MRWGHLARYLGFLAAGGCRRGRLLGARCLRGQPVHAVRAGAARRDHSGGGGRERSWAPGGTAGRPAFPVRPLRWPRAGSLSSGFRGLPSSPRLAPRRPPPASPRLPCPRPALPGERRTRPAPPSPRPPRWPPSGGACPSAAGEWVSGSDSDSITPERREAGAGGRASGQGRQGPPGGSQCWASAHRSVWSGRSG